jgi:asparagine N-glycosylation enzyme membrane subunit Stt3
MIAPVVVSAIMILYYAIYFGFLIYILSGIWRYILGIFPVVLGVLTVIVCIERIKEIKKGEEDDISKY